MDTIDGSRIPAKRRPKDSFQNELQSKLRQRKILGLSAEISDSDDDVLGPMSQDYRSSRRNDFSNDLGHGMGTTTMRSRDLTQLLRRSRDSDEEDEEVTAANFGSYGSSRNRQHGNMTSPSPKDFRKKPQAGSRESPKEQSGRLDSILGRKTPTKNSPSPTGLSKEDIIFGRNTPTKDSKKRPSDGSRLPGVDSDKPWQPPNFRSMSPQSEHSRGSRGVTPTDSGLATISETPREKVTPRMPRGQGQKSEISPRQASYDNRPQPKSRGGVIDRKTPPIGGERKTPPLAADRKTPPITSDRRTPPLSGERKTPPFSSDPRRKSPSYALADNEAPMKRTTPTLDLFGKSRQAAAGELDSYLDSDKDKKLYDGRKLGGDRQRGSTQPSPTGAPGSRTKAQTAMAGGRKTPVDSRTSPVIGRKSSVGDKSPPPSRKTPTSFGKKTAMDRSAMQEEVRPAAQKPGASLLDFLMEDSKANKPKPNERKSTRRDEKPQGKDGYSDDMFASTKRQPSGRSKSPTGRKSPGLIGRKSPYVDQFKAVEAEEPLDQENIGPRKIPKEQRAEDTSSLCEDIPPDPNRKVAREEEKAMKSGKQTTERARADNAIDTIADAQSMSFIEPAKKMRPFTASAKVEHRPKPRYGTLPGQTSKEALAERQFNSTSDIRDAIYQDWYAERQRSARRQKKEQAKKELEEKEKKKKAEEEKRLEAQASYRAWAEKKKEVLGREKAKAEREKEKKEEKEREEEEEKRVQSVKTFEVWKQKKDRMIIRELHKKNEQEEEEKEKKREEQRLKERNRQTAYHGWMRKKEHQLRSNSANKRHEILTKKKKQEEEKEELKRKEREALETYNEWMEKKERQQRLEKKRNKEQRLIMDEDDFKPAWSPASRTIPFGR